MSRLGPRNRIVFSRIVSACQGGVSALEVLTSISRILQSALVADAYCSSLLDPVTGLLMAAVSDAWPEDAKPLLLDHVLLRTPAADPYVLFRRGHRAVDVRALLKDRDRVEDDPYFEYHLSPYGYAHELQCMCVADGAPRALLTFSRQSRCGAFVGEDLRLLSAISPHVGRALRRIEIGEMRKTVPGDTTGVMLVEPGGRITFASRATQVWLAEATGEAPWQIGLRLAARIAGRRERAAGAINSIVLRRPDVGDLYRLRLDDASAGDDTIAIFVEPAHLGDTLGTLRRIGLTEREAEVALNLVRGMSAASLAVELGCARHTVNQHTKQIYDKLSVRSRADPARTLLGPPGASSPLPSPQQ